MADKDASQNVQALIFNIQRYSTEDGPGVRTTVFFKGCPLRCTWCSNPESQLFTPQLLHFAPSCLECYTCLKVCPTGASKKMDDGSVAVDRSLCTACGSCVEPCLGDAREISGTWMTVDEVYEVIEKDTVFFSNSDGGVTMGGGECLSQSEFLYELIDKCYQRGLHICLDTCGYAPWETLEKVLPKVDLVLFDIKHLDPVKHEAFTGVSNDLILENLTRLKEMGVETHLRLPLIPGFNDDEENIKATGEFMKSRGFKQIDILPYHKLGANKYDASGMVYELHDLPPLDKEKIDATAHILKSYGLEVEVA